MSIRNEFLQATPLAATTPRRPRLSCGEKEVSSSDVALIVPEHERALHKVRERGELLLAKHVVDEAEASGYLVRVGEQRPPPTRAFVGFSGDPVLTMAFPATSRIRKQA